MSSASLPEKIVVLGAGAVVRECFLPALELLGMLDRVTVVDSGNGVTGFTNRYPQARFIQADYRAWLNECVAGDYLAAVIALPNVFHDDAVRLALERGIHVLCEKPLTLNAASCRELAEAAFRHQRILAVNMVRRLYPSISLARFAMGRGLIGTLQSIDIQHGSPYGWPAETLAPFRPENGGVLADMGVHYLDLAEYLAGELNPRTYEDDYKGGVEADLSFTLRTVDGVDVSIGLSRLRNLANRIVLMGTSGKIELGVDDFARCTLIGAGTTSELTMPKPFSAGDFPVTFAACFAEQLHNFFTAIKTGQAPLADGFDAARTAAHIEWAYSHRGARPLSSTAVSVRDKTPFEAEPSPVLVTGATGFIGAHLIERLASSGFGEITAAVRRPRNCANIARFPVQLSTVDLLDPAAVRAAVKGKRFVFHLAYGRDGERCREMTVQGTRNVVQTAIDEGCEAVVVLSTAYVFGWPEQTVDETAPYRPTGGEYGTSKAEMEKWCLKAAASSGKTRIVILNPTCVYGPWGPTYSQLPVTFARSGSFCWVDGGAGAANYNFVGNLVDAMLLAAATPAAHGQRFIINDGTATWRSFLEPILEPWLKSIPSYTPAELAEIEKRNRPTLREAVRMLGASPQVREIIRKTTLGGAAVKLARRFGLVKPAPPQAGKPVISAPQAGSPPSWLADLFPNHKTSFSSEKASRILGWKPKIDLAAGQRSTIEHLAAIGLIPAVAEETVLTE